MGTGAPTRHLGPASPNPEDRHVCRRRSDGSVGETLFQAFPRSSAEDRAGIAALQAREDAIVAGLSRLWPLGVGKKTELRYADVVRGTTSFRVENWRVLRAEDLELDGGPRRPCSGEEAGAAALRCAFLVERRRETIIDGSAVLVWRYWFDLEHGALLRISLGPDGKADPQWVERGDGHPISPAFGDGSQRASAIEAPPR
jgi:hypothetical protein